MSQKQKTWDDDDDQPKPKAGQIQNDPAAFDAAKKGNDLLKRLAQETKAKKGHWEMCCGVRRWVQD